MTARLTKERIAEIRKRIEACAACNGIGTAINCSDCLAGELHSVCLADTGPCAYCGGDGKSGDDEDGMALLVEVEALEAENERLTRDPKTLPPGLMLEHVRLDGMWQDLVRERDDLKRVRDRYRAALDNAAATIERYCENCDKDHLADCRFCRDYGRDACPNDVRDDFLDMRNAADGARRALAGEEETK